VALFLATGHGRSGSLWVSQFFTEIGFPTTHEYQFGPQRQRKFRTSEASWLAVPFLDSLPKHARLLRVIRDPYAAVTSGMQLDFQEQRDATPYDRFLCEHRPDIVEPDDKLGRIIRWVTMWDAPMNDYRHEVIRPDADRLDRLGEVIEYATGATATMGRTARVCGVLGNAVNTKRRTRPETTRAQIDAHPEGWRVRKRAEFYHYV